MRTFKKILLGFLLFLLLCAAGLAAWIFLVRPKTEQTDVGGQTSEETQMREYAEETEHVTFDEDSGFLFMDNEVIVILKENAEDTTAEEYFEDINAEVDESMADLGIYRLTFSSSMDFDELEELLDEINGESFVDEAYFNLLSPISEDVVTEAEEEDDDFVYESAYEPNDPWDETDPWNISVPGGNNWGMEAIAAPSAWGYLDRLEEIRIGLVDTEVDQSHEDLTIGKCKVLEIDQESGETTVVTEQIEAGDHGTHVAGIMAADFDNETGVSGVMGGKATIYHSGFYSKDKKGNLSSRYGTAYTYLLTIKTLVDQDVRVINISQNTSRLIGFAASHGNAKAITYLSTQADLAEKGLERLIATRQEEGKPDFVLCMAAGNSNRTTYYVDKKATYGYTDEPGPWKIIKGAFGSGTEKGGSEAKYNNFLNLIDSEEVQNRIVVVGSVGIDEDASTISKTRYEYSNFSCIGDRVDVVAPGEDIYSSTVGDYQRMSGTSMAAPHVSGVAGLIFAANPDLTGPQVKQILRQTAMGQSYAQAGNSRMVHAGLAVELALQTQAEPVERVLSGGGGGLDLCFVVDTTASMGDDIDNAKENMESILATLSEKTDDYRVALIDYRDFSEKTHDSDDYPAKIQLRFTDDDDAIISAINGLDLGYGGDEPETVYSALMEAAGLDWRENAKKTIIILGDAPPHDPESYTDYTYDDVLLALYNADISIDYSDSDERAVGDLDDYLISVYSIGTSASSDAEDFFSDIAEETGGSYASVDDAEMVSDAIQESIDQMEVSSLITEEVNFDEELANTTIDIHSEDGEYLFSAETDENGRALLYQIESGEYNWKSDTIYGGGELTVGESVKLSNQEYAFTGMLRKIQKHRVLMILILAAYILLCFLIPALLRKTSRAVRSGNAKRKQKQIERNQNTMQKRNQSQTPEKNQVRYCSQCGTPNQADARFCKNCGHEFLL